MFPTQLHQGTCSQLHFCWRSTENTTIHFGAENTVVNIQYKFGLVCQVVLSLHFTEWQMNANPVLRWDKVF